MRTATKLLLAAGAVVAFKGLDNRIEVTHTEASFENLPDGFDGFKIAHISDLHSESIPGVFEEIAAQKPDMTVITGDLIHDDERSYQLVLSLLERLKEIAPLYIISGNHDLWNNDFNLFIKKACEKGAVYLDNKRITIEHKGSKIDLFGLRDPYTKATDTIIKNLDKAFSLLPENENDFSILLFHRANQFERILDRRHFDLILSGHMHGGQVRIPGIGGMVSPKSGLADSYRIFFPKYCSGVFKRENTTMIVNRGLGNPMIIPRLFNRPEIGIIELRKNNI